MNNPKYSDIEILCGDKKKLYGCRAILAARSEMFNRLLYNGMKESYEKQISFPTINTTEMEIILEYIYTGLIQEESLTKDNIVEAFYAADYFLLQDLQKIIIKTVENNLEENPTKNYSPELLSKIVNRKPLLEDNILLNLLVEAVATIPLNHIEFGRLSIAALQHLLSCTHEKEKPFATSEYGVFRYSAILAAKKVSNTAYKTLMKRLPTLLTLEHPVQVKNKSIRGCQKVAKELEPLIKFIDFKRIRGQILAGIIEPLEIIPNELLISAYRHKALLNNSDLDESRGTSLSKFNKSDHVWDESGCESCLIIEDNGKVVRAHYDCHAPRSIRAKMTLDNKCIFEWDVIIEKFSAYTRVGVGSENFSYRIGGVQLGRGWVLTYGGNFWNSKRWNKNYCPKFGDGAKITVRLDMNKKTLAFTVNDTKYPEISCNNLPSKVYPVVSLGYPDRIRIQPHKKTIKIIDYKNYIGLFRTIFICLVILVILNVLYK